MENNSQSSNNINPMLIGGAVIVLLVVGAVVVLGKGGGSTVPEPTTRTAQTNQVSATAQPEGTPNSEAVEGAIEVEGGSFYFEPNEIRVKAGEEVTITLNSVDMMHDFVIDELDVRTEIIPGGESTSVTFTPTEPGEYEFYCSVGQHRANGMFGTLIVE